MHFLWRPLLERKRKESWKKIAKVLKRRRTGRIQMRARSIEHTGRAPATEAVRQSVRVRGPVSATLYVSFLKRTFSESDLL